MRRAPTVLLAEFDTTRDVLHAAEKVRDAGYIAAGTRTRRSPCTAWTARWAWPTRASAGSSSSCALTGLSGAFVMMHWMNGIDYPLVIGGKPAARRARCRRWCRSCSS